MVKLNHTQSRNHTVEQTFREHIEPKVGDIVLALDYRPGSDVIMIGRLVKVEADDFPLGKFAVESIEWKDNSTMNWEQAYKIPEGLVSVETND